MAEFRSPLKRVAFRSSKAILPFSSTAAFTAATLATTLAVAHQPHSDLLSSLSSSRGKKPVPSGDCSFLLTGPHAAACRLRSSAKWNRNTRAATNHRRFRSRLWLFFFFFEDVAVKDESPRIEQAERRRRHRLLSTISPLAIKYSPFAAYGAEHGLYQTFIMLNLEPEGAEKACISSPVAAAA
ncbi:unnamed protein product [Notodromas monacha]|uniref:Uncharacterized protein n=1 Tax=Notodromas monacha TaxID=399045 RepID=A0A7R9BZ24_9CRUS|nr:unnamed protein product [Notodromas monacha]CAG0924304.1 unnamed protein product [Notodromas monacha]